MEAALAQLSPKERTIFESHRPRIREVISAFHAGDYAHSDSMSLQLLADTSFPTCWRGACHLLLATIDCGSAELTALVREAQAQAQAQAKAASALYSDAKGLRSRTSTCQGSDHEDEDEDENEGSKTPTQRDFTAAERLANLTLNHRYDTRPPLPQPLPNGLGGPKGGPPASLAFVLDHARAAHAAYELGHDEAPGNPHRRKLFGLARGVLEVVDAEVFAVRDLRDQLGEGQTEIWTVARKEQHRRRGELVPRWAPLEKAEWGEGEGEVEEYEDDGGALRVCEMREDWGETRERLSCVGCWRSEDEERGRDGDDYERREEERKEDTVQ